MVSLQRQCLQQRVVSTSQKLIKDVEVALSFGLMNDTRLLQQVIQNMATYWIALNSSMNNR